eukprot:2770675-Rhodomonas_salina.3
MDGNEVSRKLTVLNEEACSAKSNLNASCSIKTHQADLAKGTDNCSSGATQEKAVLMEHVAAGSLRDAMPFLHGV